MRTRVIAALLAGALLILTACGGGGGNGGTPAALAPPTNLTATAGDSEVILNWQASPTEGIEKYNILQGTTSGNLSKTADVDGTQLSYRVSGLSNGTTYFFAVEAENSSGKKSAKSNEASATPAAIGPGTPPTVITTSPADGATGVGTNVNINVTFSKPMDEASTQGAFSVDPAVTCDFTWNSTSRRVTCDPQDDLDPGETYTVTIAGSASDQDGHVLPAAEQFTFATGGGVASSCTFGESSFGSCAFGP